MEIAKDLEHVELLLKASEGILLKISIKDDPDVVKHLRKIQELESSIRLDINQRTRKKEKRHLT
jgi:hypothetical protein